MTQPSAQINVRTVIASRNNLVLLSLQEFVKYYHHRTGAKFKGKNNIRVFLIQNFPISERKRSDPFIPLIKDISRDKGELLFNAVIISEVDELAHQEVYGTIQSFCKRIEKIYSIRRYCGMKHNILPAFLGIHIFH